MKKISIGNCSRFIALLLTVLMAATGCDFLRKLAGRPTSADLAVMAEDLRARQEAADKAARDSAEAALLIARYRAD